MGVHSIVIEDDPGITFLHKLMLEESHFANRIDSFDKVKPALEFISKLDGKTDPVVIFLDINLPVVSGWDFLEELRVLNNQIPIYVVMVTASLNISDRDKSKRYESVIDFVEKPISLDVCEKLKKTDELKAFF